MGEAFWVVGLAAADELILDVVMRLFVVVVDAGGGAEDVVTRTVVDAIKLEDSEEDATAVAETTEVVVSAEVLSTLAMVEMDADADRAVEVLGRQRRVLLLSDARPDVARSARERRVAANFMSAEQRRLVRTSERELAS